MKKINFIKLLLIIWLRIIEVSKSTVAKAATTIQPVIKKPKFLYRLDNRDGRYLEKTLLARGITVILYKLQKRRSRYGTYFILPVLSHVVTACINPPDSASGKAKLALEIQTAAAGTLYITIPPVLYGTVLDGLIETMQKAKGANQILAAWRALKAQLDLIKAPVQVFMNTLDPIDAAIVCAYYKFHVQGMGGGHAQIFEGEEGTLAGEIDLLFPVGPGECSYTVKIYSADRSTFDYYLGTDLAHQTIPGFVSGSLQQVSVTIVHHGEVVSESDIISVRAK
jgi:hypothetical protein